MRQLAQCGVVEMRALLLVERVVLTPVFIQKNNFCVVG